MIGMLTGRIAYKMSDHLVLDVGGVGYQVYCSERTLAGIGRAGDLARLYTELVVREDLLQLFGFSQPAEREWYKLLTTVQGVGGKAAMNILGALGPDGIGRAITLGDMNAVKSAPGVGPKLAQRIVNELKDKAAIAMAQVPISIADSPLESTDDITEEFDNKDFSAPVAAVASNQGALQAEAMSALANLGYDRSAAAQAVAQVLMDSDFDDVGQVIKAALKRLMPGQ